MGAAPSHLERFVKTALAEMPLAPKSGSAIGAADWRRWLGEESAYADYLGFFQKEVARLDGRAALHTYLPELAPGLAAAACHPMIRTAFGVIAEDDNEIAVGLADWASHYFVLAPTEAGNGEIDPWLLTGEDPVLLLGRLRQQSDLEYQPDPDIPVDREIATAAAHPRFAGIANALTIDHLTLGRLREAALLLYISAPDSRTLLGLCSLHAARVLSDFTQDQRSFSAAVWRLLLALSLSLNRPELLDAETAAVMTTGELPDWDAILPALVASEDHHAIRLGYTCLAETRAGGSPLYRLLAAQKAGLIGTPESVRDRSVTEARSAALGAAAGR
jgi:hypothetical protein